MNWKINEIEKRGGGGEKGADRNTFKNLLFSWDILSLLNKHWLESPLNNFEQVTELTRKNKWMLVERKYKWWKRAEEGKREKKR